MSALGPVSWIVISPVLAALAILFVPKSNEKIIKAIALGAGLSSMLLSIMVYMGYDTASGGYQFVDKIHWIKSLGIHYHVGVDGLNATLLLMTAIVSFAGIVVSLGVKKDLKSYLIFYMILVSGCLGVLSALNIFFIYFFYETAVLPVFPLIGIWGSGQNKQYATMKLTLYLTLGAVTALVALLGIYWTLGMHTFDLPLIEKALSITPLPVDFQRWAFGLIVLGFGVILTLWPFHTWSPMGYAAAPTSVSMLHAGVLKKLGAYAIIRLGISLMPQGAQMWMPYIAALAVMNMLYCGMVAYTQKDLKYILGYSSCSHMGYILLGLACLTPTALSGTVYFMFAHGIMASLGFALVGHIYEQTHTRTLDDWSGFAKKVPLAATLFIMISMASLGLPGFANFIGETMIILGAWDAYRFQAICAILGLVVTAGYTLNMILRTMHGPLKQLGSDITLNDLGGANKFVFLGLMALLILLGVFPNLLMPAIESATQTIFQRIY